MESGVHAAEKIQAKQSVVSQEQALLEEEKRDRVDPSLPVPPPRERAGYGPLGKGPAPGRRATAAVGNSAQLLGLGQEPGLDGRVAMLAGGSPPPGRGAGSNSPTKARGAPSVIQLDRQERVRKKIQREKEMDSDQLAGRALKTEDHGRGHASFKEGNNDELTSQEAAELLDFKRELDREDEEERRRNDARDEGLERQIGEV